MISYKYKLCNSRKLKALDHMMSEAAFVWNHALALTRYAERTTTATFSRQETSVGGASPIWGALVRPALPAE